MSDSDDEEDEKFLETLQRSLLPRPPSVDMNVVLDAVGDFLRAVRQPIYAVDGGRAVNAWLNPNNKGLTDVEKHMVKTVDWDIITMQDPKRFLRQLHAYLVSKFGDNFEIRDTDILKLSSDSDIYVYQIGIQNGRHTIWFVDIHTGGDYNIQDLIKLQGIWYLNLHHLVNSIAETIDSTSEKRDKRLIRRDILQRALHDMRLFNPVIYNELCKQCETNENEKITGFNLSCDDIRKTCPKYILEQKRKERMKNLE